MNILLCLNFVLHFQHANKRAFLLLFFIVRMNLISRRITEIDPKIFYEKSEKNFSLKKKSRKKKFEKIDRKKFSQKNEKIFLENVRMKLQNYLT